MPNSWLCSACCGAAVLPSCIVGADYQAAHVLCPCCECPFYKCPEHTIPLLFPGTCTSLTSWLAQPNTAFL